MFSSAPDRHRLVQGPGNILTEIHRAMLWSIQPPHTVPTMTAVIYFGEIAFAAILAIILLASSTLKVGDATVLFFCGVVALTLAEYTVHRFLLHDIAPGQLGFIMLIRSIR
jgi:hypothetical protein